MEFYSTIPFIDSKIYKIITFSFFFFFENVICENFYNEYEITKMIKIGKILEFYKIEKKFIK